MAGERARMKLLDATLVAAFTYGAQEVFPEGFEAWLRLNKIARATGYRHKTRVLAEGKWQERSRRPVNSPGRTPRAVADRVVQLRRSLGRENGARSIHAELTRLAAQEDWQGLGLLVPSPATIHKIIAGAGLVVPQPKKRPRSSYRRFCYARPRDCYQIDATQIALVGGVLAAVFEVLDDCTRVLVASHAAPSEDSAGAVAAIQAAFAGHGVPALVLSDNGIVFTARYMRPGSVARFTRVVTTAGARQITSAPYHPQTCGKVERAHRTFKEWLTDQPLQPATLEELQKACDTYRTWYNNERRHSVHGCPPQRAWDNAVDLGGPQHLPIQDDADVSHRKVNSTGRVRAYGLLVTIGRAHIGKSVTLVRNRNHLTVYEINGRALGDLNLNFDRHRQGRIRPAA